VGALLGPGVVSSSVPSSPPPPTHTHTPLRTDPLDNPRAFSLGDLWEDGRLCHSQTHWDALGVCTQGYSSVGHSEDVQWASTTCQALCWALGSSRDTQTACPQRASNPRKGGRVCGSQRSHPILFTLVQVWPKQVLWSMLRS
jgi:hypothetical protein